MSYAKKQRQLSLIISLIGAVFFVIITLTTIVWATGLQFNSANGSFEKTAVIAVNNSLSEVTVSLDGKVVGNATPITLDGLKGGRYRLTITKPNFYPYEKTFHLSPGQAGVVKKVTLIAQEPLLTDAPDAVYLPSEPFDVGLVFEDGELVDFGSLVTRFSTPILQAHRLNTGYLYQQGGDLHLYFAENSQDLTVFHSDAAAAIKLNLSPSSWAVTLFSDAALPLVFDGTAAKQLLLTTPTVAKE